MNKNKFILSLFFMLLIAIATNLFTEFINNRTENKEQELNILEEDLKYKQQTLEQIKNKIKITDDIYTSSSNEFKDKFGYDYNIPQEEEIRNFSLMKKEENKEIKENIKNLIINYKNYYEGSIYDSEFFDSYMSNFTSLTEDVNYEQYRDIAKDLKIDLFINKVEDGAIYYIKNRNKDKKEYTVLVDGNLKIKEYTGKQLPIVKGDAKSLSIAAASIIAKVTRDRLMKDLASVYPDYHFEKHKGYGTKVHIEVIKDKGAIEGVHRKVFLRKINNTWIKKVL